MLKKHKNFADYKNSHIFAAKLKKRTRFTGLKDLQDNIL